MWANYTSTEPDEGLAACFLFFVTLSRTRKTTFVIALMQYNVIMTGREETHSPGNSLKIEMRHWMTSDIPFTEIFLISMNFEIFLKSLVITKGLWICRNPRGDEAHVCRWDSQGRFLNPGHFTKEVQGQTLGGILGVDGSGGLAWCNIFLRHNL